MKNCFLKSRSRRSSDSATTANPSSANPNASRRRIGTIPGLPASRAAAGAPIAMAAVTRSPRIAQHVKAVWTWRALSVSRWTSAVPMPRSAIGRTRPITNNASVTSPKSAGLRSRASATVMANCASAPNTEPASRHCAAPAVRSVRLCAAAASIVVSRSPPGLQPARRIYTRDISLAFDRLKSASGQYSPRRLQRTRTYNCQFLRHRAGFGKRAGGTVLGSPLIDSLRTGPSLMTRSDESRSSSATAASDAPVVVIGAGPAGLTAARELARRGVPVAIVEADARVGGLAQTVEYKGFRFDIGGHRFYTKIPAVRALWRAMLGADFLRRPRLSRIFYGRRFFHYPLKPANALWNLGVVQSFAILASYLATKMRPIHPEVSFEDWVCNRFGRRLYRIFFESYTEKVWGVPGSAISARWAAQRIRNFSLGTAIARMLMPWRDRQDGQVVTLIEEFEYPRLGPGMMWEAFAKEIERLGGRVLLNTRVTGID